MSTPNASSMLAVGTVLNGMYRIERHLSSGGFGNTYVAINLTFGYKVAVKEFFMRGVTQRDGDSTISVSNPDNRALFNEQLEKFKKEAQRIRRLQSPHIIRVHDMFDANGTAYYVMDYIDGESLSDRLKRIGKPLSEGEVRHYLAQVLDALEVIHSAGLYHMDLKPDNIMVDGSDRAVLIDFGASKRVSGSQMTMTATGVSYTNGYAPPEQMEQDTDHFGPWTDIYALGATLYRLLTNRKPPMPSAIYSDPTPDKHEVLPFTEGVSTNLRRVIVQMVAVRWNVRPQSIAALRNMLAQGDADFADDDESTEMMGTAAATDEVTRMKTPFAATEIEREENYDDREKSFSRKWIYAIVGVLVLAVAAIAFSILRSGDKEPVAENQTEQKDTVIPKKILPLSDGYYCFEGSWQSAKHKMSECRVQFTKSNETLSECSYTNILYGYTIPLTGSVIEDKMHFTGKINGKDLVIDLHCSESDPSALEGTGTDYAHSGEEAPLQLSKTDKQAKDIMPTYMELYNFIENLGYSAFDKMPSNLKAKGQSVGLDLIWKRKNEEDRDDYWTIIFGKNATATKDSQGDYNFQASSPHACIVLVSAGGMDTGLTIGFKNREDANAFAKQRANRQTKRDPVENDKGEHPRRDIGGYRDGGDTPQRDDDGWWFFYWNDVCGRCP